MAYLGMSSKNGISIAVLFVSYVTVITKVRIHYHYSLLITYLVIFHCIAKHNNPSPPPPFLDDLELHTANRI